jgi:hypothetical protein
LLVDSGETVDLAIAIGISAVTGVNGRAISIERLADFCPPSKDRTLNHHPVVNHPERGPCDALANFDHSRELLSIGVG